MKFETTCKIAGIICILLAGLAGIASATTITVGGGQIPSVGGQISIPIILDSAPTGLSYYQVTLTSSDPSVANIVAVTYPSWASLNNTGALPSGSVKLIAIDLGHSNPSGSSNILLATVTVQGIQAGSTQLTLTSNSLGNNGQEAAADAVVPGTIQVIGTVPTTAVTSQATTAATTQATTAVTTQVTTAVTTQATTAATTQATTAVTTQATTAVTTQATTAVTTQATTAVTTEATTVVPTTVVTTAVPTTAPYTGPTGQAYLSTTPQGAHIVLDGTPSGAITPIIMTVPVGSHEVILKLAGYDELQANFEVKTNAMTTVSRRLSPGSSVIPITPGTTVVTTVPTTTVTQVTTVPTVAPTTFPTSQGSGALQIPSWATRFLSIFKIPWG